MCETQDILNLPFKKVVRFCCVKASCFITCNVKNRAFPKHGEFGEK